MTLSKKKRLMYLSGLLSIIGILFIIIVIYFLFQSVRETFYQNSFESKYDFVSLKEDGEVFPVQVFHGVKVDTFLEEKEVSNKKSGNIIFEVKDEPKETLMGFNVHSERNGMSAFSEAIQYKVMVENETGKESFIIAMKITPESEKLITTPSKYKTYSVNENGVIKISEFTLHSKSKLETQWIRGLSGEKHGYYTDLPYQKGGAFSLISFAILGILSLIGGVWLRRRAGLSETEQSA
ncbi:hypothetical protein FGG79_19850 [Bacillus sp. BHET2]|uniref:hypothetical protein n=1 Tax=Bacillus sp. BHET2 TaxID=2583818 RepID=UPI00110D63E9|nr:hypothetical protein [Bacillus sp. BHET2]TMU83464.1 hypothetical protein FGG79_19850 [Bacillus sp. BHET2]